MAGVDEMVRLRERSTDAWMRNDVRTSEELTKAASQMDATARGLIVSCIVPGPICAFCRTEITRSQGIEECPRCYAGPFHLACYRYHVCRPTPLRDGVIGLGQLPGPRELPVVGCGGFDGHLDK